MTAQRIIIFSHAHPQFSKGGAEIAAYNLYLALKGAGLDCYFIAACDKPNLHSVGCAITRIADSEFLFMTPPVDKYLFGANIQGMTTDLFDLIKSIQPHILHVHHYMGFGIELLKFLKSLSTSLETPASLFVTLHEYMAICANDGQMVRRDNNELCSSSFVTKCAGCIGSNPSFVFFREFVMRSNLEYVDQFISPSHFLKQRYIDWGLRQPIEVIENLIKTPDASITDYSPSTGGFNFAYFGQANQFKGLDVLLRATAILLDKQDQLPFRVYINASGLETQPSGFQQEIKLLLKRVKPVVSWNGSYSQDTLTGRMLECNCVVVPSIWWENSPMVIQEALAHFKPVLAANIGGMIEKITDGENGLLFDAGSPTSLSAKMQHILENPECLSASVETTRDDQNKLALEQHLLIYGQ